MAGYVFHIARLTGWGFDEIMERVPVSAGLQIIDADLYSQGIERFYRSAGVDFDSLATIEEAFHKLKKR